MVAYKAEDSKLARHVALKVLTPFEPVHCILILSLFCLQVLHIRVTVRLNSPQALESTPVTYRTRVGYVDPKNTMSLEQKLRTRRAKFTRKCT